MEMCRSTLQRLSACLQCSAMDGIIRTTATKSPAAIALAFGGRGWGRVFAETPVDDDIPAPPFIALSTQSFAAFGL